MTSPSPLFRGAPTLLFIAAPHECLVQLIRAKVDVVGERPGAEGRRLRTGSGEAHALLFAVDDNDRVLLRIESQIFVGTVTAELQSVRFENG